jgi:hypothetical protein
VFVRGPALIEFDEPGDLRDVLIPMTSIVAMEACKDNPKHTVIHLNKHIFRDEKCRLSVVCHKSLDEIAIALT